MKKKHIWLAAAVIWCAAIFIAAGSPSSTGGNTQTLLQKILHLTEGQAEIVNIAFRKSVHLSAFGLLAILFYNSFEEKRYVKAWLLTTLYAATDEIHQAFLPNRTGAVLDVMIDSVGALIALLLVKLVSSKIRAR